MISTNLNSKIYIFCPANFETGGTELAHQLVDYLISKNIDAYIVYFDNNKIIDSDVPAGFRKYNIKTKIVIDDEKDNVIVLPEVTFSFVNNFSNVQYVFWWMSVDNFFYKSSFRDYILFLPFLNSLKLIFSRLKKRQNIFNGFSIKKLKNVKNKNLHVYQSTYAKIFLLNKGFSNILPLSDYINSDFYKNEIQLSKKKNQILYNPAKGYRTTKKIMKRLKDYEFIPLKNLKRYELSELFAKSKVYIDFGNHPGKDRLPREAVMHNCCVIVGKKGSALYFEDIPISKTFKIHDRKINNIAFILKEVIENYDTYNSEFNFYRNRINKEKKIFFEEIDQIFFN